MTVTPPSDNDKGFLYHVLEPVLRPLARLIIENPKWFFIWLGVGLLPLFAVTVYYTLRLLQQEQTASQDRSAQYAALLEQQARQQQQQYKVR